jgi:hypothetical protein
MIFAVEVGGEARTGLQVQAARAVGTGVGLIADGAEIPWAEQPDAGECGTELCHQATGDGREYVFELQLGRHLERYPL